MMNGRFKPNEVVTLVSKGVRHLTASDHTYIDETQIGNTSFLKITRVGRDYIYGKYLYLDQDGQKECCWEAKVTPEEYIILEGIRRDLEANYKQYQQELRRYEEARKQARSDFEKIAYEMVTKQMQFWDEENPRPKPPSLS